MHSREKTVLVLYILRDLLIALLTFPFLLLPSLGNLSNKVPISFKRSFKSSARHREEVSRVRESVKSAYAVGSKIVLAKRPGQGHSARSPAYKSGHYGVDVSKLTSILHIDAERKTVRVQAGVSYLALCTETLKYGLLPLVVPEFKSITVGGAIQGIGIESSSWANGAVDEGVLDATLILGNGALQRASDVPDLWRDVPGSNGTLTLIVDATLRLAKAQEYTTIRYELFDELDSFLGVFKEMHASNVWDWQGTQRLIDAVQIKGLGIVAMFAGTLSGSDAKRRGLRLYEETPFSPFFFQHVKHIAETHLSGSTKTSIYREYMPTLQYLFRYDRGGFWGIMSLAAVLPPLGFVLDRPALTGFLNHFFETSTLYKLAMLASDQSRESVGMLQDVDVPHSEAHAVIDWAAEHGLEYLWLCPVRNGAESMFSVGGASEWVLNIGLYGAATNLPWSNLELQRLVAKCGGRTALYAHIYADRREFWGWYDEGRYARSRTAHHGETFLGLWEKVGGLSRTTQPGT